MLVYFKLKLLVINFNITFVTAFEVVSVFHCAKSSSSNYSRNEDNKRDATEKRRSGTTMSFPGESDGYLVQWEGVPLGSCFPQRFKL